MKTINEITNFYHTVSVYGKIEIIVSYKGKYFWYPTYTGQNIN